MRNNLEQPSAYKILVVDDEDAIREVMLRGIQRAGFQCSTVGSAEEALERFQQETFDVVITDIKMPGMDGIELSQRIKDETDADVIIMTGYIEDFTFEKIIEYGASDFIQKPVGIKEMLIRLSRVINERNLLIQRDRAVKKMRESLSDYRRAIDGFVQAISRTVETRDPYTAGHQKRVADLACAIAREMGLNDERIDVIRMASTIHDLGKIAVPAEILSKPGKLTDLEFAIIKTHPEVGYNILESMAFPWPIDRMVRQHHERTDGSGYPDGLQGSDILEEARIIAVADVVEAIASHRPYRAALGIDIALGEITGKRKILYDADATDACLQLFQKGVFQFE